MQEHTASPSTMLHRCLQGPLSAQHKIAKYIRTPSTDQLQLHTARPARHNPSSGKGNQPVTNLSRQPWALLPTLPPALLTSPCSAALPNPAWGAAGELPWEQRATSDSSFRFPLTIPQPCASSNRLKLCTEIRLEKGWEEFYSVPKHSSAADTSNVPLHLSCSSCKDTTRMGWEGEAMGGMVALASSLVTCPLSGSARQGSIRDSTIPTRHPTARGDPIHPTPSWFGEGNKHHGYRPESLADNHFCKVLQYLNKLESANLTFETFAVF